jgi:hypothetical protein
MDVTINDQSIPVDFSQFHNLEEVIVELHENFIPAGQQLYQVHVNGEFFSERYPRESRYVNLGEVATISLKTISDQDMARVILNQSVQQAEVLCQALEQGAALFRLAAEDEANYYFAQVLDSLRWLLQVGDIASQVLNNNGGQPSLPSISHFLRNLGRLLDEMLQISEEEDYIMLADLMEYELLPMVQEWQRILSQLASP